MTYFEDKCDRCGIRMCSDQKQRKDGRLLLCVSCTADLPRASGPKVRELRVFDIRCACGAGPGAICDLTRDRVNTDRGTHLSRIREHAELAAEGWEWQEVDPRDAGARNA